MTEEQLDFYKRLAHALALQFGSSCEVQLRGRGA